jgi:hypothetical protein
VIGAETFEDRPAHRVRVTLADGWKKQYLNSLQWDSIRTNVDVGARELGRPPDP